MNRFVLRLPDELYETVRARASRQGLSINQYLLYTITRMVTAEETEAFFNEKARPQNIDKALRLLDNAPDHEPDDPADRMPRRRTRRI